jgi:hypothetical protein
LLQKKYQQLEVENKALVSKKELMEKGYKELERQAKGVK